MSNSASFKGLIPQIFWGFACLFFLLTIIGAINHITPVPFWDMWDGNVLFYTRLLDGDTKAWWAQHVNHRTIFSNVLFFIDHKLFHGRNYFLIFSHFILMTCLVLWFYLMLASPNGSKKNSPRNTAILAVISTLSFSWIQSTNITWAFQSQMFAANLLPAFSFYFLFKSNKYPAWSVSNVIYTLTSILFGFFSAFTMMNGVLALPFLLVLAIAFRSSLVVIGSIVIVMLITLKLYFTGYYSPAGQGNMVETILSQPLEIIKFSFLFLGAPAYYITGNGYVAFIVGVIVAGLLSSLLLKLFIRNQNDPRTFVIACLLAYEAATIGGIASGRLVHGINQAFESRYMTTSLLIWSLLILMSAIVFQEVNNKKPRLVWGYLLIPLFFLPYQFKALNTNIIPRYQTLVAALALELEVRDQDQLRYIWPDMDILYILAEPARNHNVSIFNHFLFSGLKESLGIAFNQKETPDKFYCKSSFPKIDRITNDDNFNRITARVTIPDNVKMPQRFSLVDKKGIIIGYGLTETRIPAFRWSWKRKKSAKITGYILKSDDKNALMLKSGGVTCTLGVI